MGDKKYTVYAQQITILHKSGRYNSNHEKYYQAVFKNKEKAIRKAEECYKEAMEGMPINYIVVKELDTDNKIGYRSGNQMSSGVYISCRDVTEYTDKKVIYKKGDEFSMVKLKEEIKNE